LAETKSIAAQALGHADEAAFAAPDLAQAATIER
jgi:hypothetical protein